MLTVINDYNRFFLLENFLQYELDFIAILLDFGLAKDLKIKGNVSAIFRGNVKYSSPESRKGILSEKSDVFSVAAMFLDFICPMRKF